MTVGVVVLAHKDFPRVVDLVSYFCDQQVPVALHIDRASSVPLPIQKQLDCLPGLNQLPRRTCRWGGWSIVEATLDGVRNILDRHLDVTHVALVSGNCVPVRPIPELRRFLSDAPNCDFIQSVQATAADWVVDGLQTERFQYRFPFSYQTQKSLFDMSVRLQRRLPRSWSRVVPGDLIPCVGSQWWCLSRRTLSAILEDPCFAEYKRYFRGTWIPDESFFQTLVRKHGRQIEARSLTWAPFDSLGRPVTLYDDHLLALRRIEDGYFFARKIWPGACAIYDHCLSASNHLLNTDGQALSRIADGARTSVAQMTPGISRADTPPSEVPYLVLYGADMLFPGLGHAVEQLGQGPWLGPQFEQRKGKPIRSSGGLSGSVAIARANPAAYLSNLLRGRSGRPVVVLRTSAPVDAMKAVVKDPKATVLAIAGAWTIPLHRDRNRSDAAFATHQRAEMALLQATRVENALAQIRHWSLADALQDPDTVLTQIGLPAGTLALANTDDLPAYLQQVRNSGMNPSMSVAAQLRPRQQRTDLAAE